MHNAHIVKHEKTEWYSPWRVKEMLSVKSVPGMENGDLGYLPNKSDGA